MRSLRTTLISAFLGGLALVLVAPAARAEPFDWSGFFIGGNLGSNWQSYDFGDYHTKLDLTQQFFEFEASQEGPLASVSPKEPIPSEFLFFNTEGNFHNNHQGGDAGLTGGTQLGFNKQFGPIVIGLEGTFNANNNSRSGWTESRDTQSSDFFFDGVSADTTHLSMRNAQANWNSAILSKLGFAHGPWLFYGVGGVAFTDVTAWAHDNAASDFFANNFAPQPLQEGGFLGSFTDHNKSSDNEFFVGWTAGGGIEYALSQLFSVALEYRHSGFGNETFHFDSHGPITPGNSSISTDSDMVTFKVNFYFSHLPH